MSPTRTSPPAAPAVDANETVRAAFLIYHDADLLAGITGALLAINRDGVPYTYVAKLGTRCDHVMTPDEAGVVIGAYVTEYVDDDLEARDAVDFVITLGSMWRVQWDTVARAILADMGRPQALAHLAGAA